MVYAPYSTAPDYPLKKWDVITRIGDQPLDSQGKVKIRDDLRLSFEYFVPKTGPRRPRAADDRPRRQAPRG